MDNWQPIETAPISTPLKQQWFLAYCPSDDWGDFGRVHVAVRYLPGTSVRPRGTNGERPATHWMPAPSPPNTKL